MNELKVDNVIISRQGKDSSNYQEFIRIINKKKINVIEVEKRRWIINSIVAKLVYEDFSMLFTGDIEEIAEKQILSEYKNNIQNLKSTILKIAHHRF